MPLVAHIIYSLSTGGLENGLVNILNRLPRDSYRHAIICITVADSFAERITAENVEVFELHKRAGHDVAFYGRMRRLLKRLRPDIVHSRNLAALETQICTIGLGVSRVHGEHGREIGDVDGSNRKYLLLRRCLRPLIDRYITVSRDLQQWLIEAVGVDRARVTQIYNGVDHQRFRPTEKKPLHLLPPASHACGELLVVGTVGRLSPVKDQQLLLRAIAQLRAKVPALVQRMRFLVVGDGPLRGALESLADELDLSEIVWFAGERSDVAELLQVMDLFVLPSLGEGISNTVLEAQASGLPVIATAVGGNLELIEQDVNGRLIPAGDSAALCRELQALAEDESARTRMGRAAAKRVVNGFDWGNTAAQYAAVYDELLGAEGVS